MLAVIALACASATVSDEKGLRCPAGFVPHCRRLPGHQGRTLREETPGRTGGHVSCSRMVMRGTSLSRMQDVAAIDTTSCRGGASFGESCSRSLPGSPRHAQV